MCASEDHKQVEHKFWRFESNVEFTDENTTEEITGKLSKLNTRICSAETKELLNVSDGANRCIVQVLS
jgi:hypothetical protein